MSSYLERSEQLLGKAKIKGFGKKLILVVGVGGVGGTTLEGLARSGFKKFVIIDSDKVDVSNLNRQILFTSADVGKTKVEVAKKRLEAISKDIKCETICEKVDVGNLEKLLKYKPDFIVDAIDFVPGKLEIYKYALKNKIEGVYRLADNNFIGELEFVLSVIFSPSNCSADKLFCIFNAEYISISYRLLINTIVAVFIIHIECPV